MNEKQINKIDSLQKSKTNRLKSHIAAIFTWVVAHLYLFFKVVVLLCFHCWLFNLLFKRSIFLSLLI